MGKFWQLWAKHTITIIFSGTVEPLYKGHPWSEDKVAFTEGYGKWRCKQIVPAFTEGLAFLEGRLCRGVSLYIAVMH